MLTRLVHRAVSPAVQGREAGAGVVEYAGLVVLVFLVLVGLVASGLPLNLSAGIDQELCQVFSSSYDCAHPPQARGDHRPGGDQPGTRDDQPGTGGNRPGAGDDSTGRPSPDSTGRPEVPAGHHPDGSDTDGGGGSGDPVGGFFTGVWRALTDPDTRAALPHPLERLFTGVGGALLDAGKGMLDLGERLVTDPWGTVKNIGTGAYRALRSHLDPYAHQALGQWRDGDWLGALATSGKAIFTTQWDTLGLGGLWNMSVDEKVRAAWNRGDYLTAIGRGLTNAAMAVDPGTWLTKLGPISKAARAANKATHLAKSGSAAKQAAKAASKAQHAAKHGDLPAAERAAQQARRKADTAKRNAKKHGCKTGSLTNLPPPPHTGGRYAAPLSPSNDPCNAATQAEKDAEKAESNVHSGDIDPKNIRFTQDSISGNFSDGRTVEQAIRDLKAGKIKASDFPPILVTEHNGKIYSLDNRRLYVFKQAGVKVRYKMATPEQARQQWRKKFTTKNDGTDIEIRRKRGR